MNAARGRLFEAPLTARHTAFDDVQGLFSGCLLVALGVLMIRHAGLVTGGTAGLSILLHYRTEWSLGALLFAVNLPFYVFGWKAMGRTFTLKTFAAVTLLSVFVAVIPSVFTFDHLDPAFASVAAGLLCGCGILMLIRHGASLGGIGILAIWLQKTRGWRAGTVQMVFDGAILVTAFGVVAPVQILWSLVGAAMLNLVIGINHRADRYYGG